MLRQGRRNEESEQDLGKEEKYFGEGKERRGKGEEREKKERRKEVEGKGKKTILSSSCPFFWEERGIGG